MMQLKKELKGYLGVRGNNLEVEKVVLEYWQFVFKICCKNKMDLKNQMLYFLHHSEIVLSSLFNNVTSCEFFHQKYMTSINTYLKKCEEKYDSSLEGLIGRNHKNKKFKIIVFVFEEITWELYKSFNFGKEVV